MELRGDFEQKYRAGAVRPTGTLFKFSGDSTQKIMFTHPDITNWSYFKNLELASKKVYLGSNLYVSGKLTNRGLFEVSATKTLFLSGDSAVNTTGATINGSGTIDAPSTSFLNKGRVAPGLSPATLSLSGTYRQSSTGSLEIELGGLTVGSEHDRLAVSGTVNIGGLLSLSLIDGFSPALGDSFRIMTYNSAGGAFDSVSGNSQSGFAFDVRYKSDGVDLITVEALNNAPRALNDSIFTREDSTIQIFVLRNDSDADGDSLRIVSLNMDGASGLAVIDPGDTSLTYTPASDVNGRDVFSYTLSDGRGGTDQADVIVDITAQNDAPVAGLLLLPADRDTLDTKNNISFLWRVAEDADGDNLSYFLHIGNTSGFDTSITVQDDTSYTFDGSMLSNGTAYSWFVDVSDGQLTTAGADTFVFHTPVITALEDAGKGLPLLFSLEQNYPNPFNPQTTIRYALPRAVSVRLVIYNALGRMVRDFDLGLQTAGRKTLVWDGRDMLGRNVSSGAYFYKITAGKYINIRKALLVK